MSRSNLRSLVLALLALSAAAVVVGSSAARSDRSSAGAQLLANGDFSSGLSGWWGRNARLVAGRHTGAGLRPTRVLVGRRTSGAGIATWPRVRSRRAPGTLVVARASVRAAGAGGPVCIRVREFGRSGLAAVGTHCARATTSWRQVQVRYRLKTSHGSLGVVVYRLHPRRGLAFEVKRVSLRARGFATSRRAGTTASTTLTLGISANSQAWGSNAGVMQDRVVRLGLHWLREDFLPSGPGQVDSTRWDAVFAAAAARRLMILPIFTNPEDYEDTAFVASAVARYGPGGLFWRQHPELDGSFAPTWWEVGNEPYWKNQTPATYARDYKAAVVAGRAANPDVKFLLAAYPAWRNPRTGQWESWVASLFSAVPDLAGYVDGWSDHPYCNADGPSAWTPDSPDWYWQFLQFTKVHAEFAAHGLGDAPMWLTEFGYSTAGDRSVTEAQQADYLVQAVRLLQGYSYAQALFLYQLQDWGPRDGDREHYFGLSRADGTPKPAWAAVAELAAG